jgi:antitoxin component of MazEF toxin-antitoxin module
MATALQCAQIFYTDLNGYLEKGLCVMSGSRILGTIHGDGDDVYVSLPLQVLAAAGINVGDVVEVSIIDKTIRLAPLDRSEPDTVLDGLVASVHEDALNFFEGNVVAAERWMSGPVRGLGGRSPNQMLKTEKDIEAVRILIARLEHGSMP